MLRLNFTKVADETGKFPSFAVQEAVVWFEVSVNIIRGMEV